jgi:preprotein translocase subunit SecB
MAENSTNGGGLANPAPQQAQPQLLVLGQYTKDLSFENPNAPRSLQQAAQPQISVTVNVNANALSETDVEVTLKLEGKAEAAGTLLFNVELVFGGVFRLQNVPQENVHPMLMIECPRLLFPFAREIVANAVRNGGFPPLLLDPIDFVALYQQRAAQEQQAPPVPSSSNIRW